MPPRPRRKSRPCPRPGKAKSPEDHSQGLFIYEVLPSPDTSRTISLLMELRLPWSASSMGWGRVNRRKLRSALHRERGWPNPIVRARVYTQALDRLGSYGRVAQEFGVTREEVCQYVTVVRRLPPELVTIVERHGNPMPDGRYSLRALLRAARLSSYADKTRAFKAISADEVLSLKKDEALLARSASKERDPR